VRTEIVVPCYNEESRLDRAAFGAFIDASDDVGLIFVNDGSSDRTLDVLHELERRRPGRVRVIDQQPNQGKAEAVRVGMLEAMALGAVYAGFFDADLATPLDAIRDLAEVLDRDASIDIVLGARVALLGRRIDRKATRHYLGRIFATAASLVLGLPVYDTQCGAKMFRVTPVVRDLFERPFGSRWIFDVEIIARYLSGRGDRRRLFELPLRSWTDVGDSRVKARDFLRAGGEMAAIYRGYRLQRHVDFLLRVLAASFLRYIGAGGVGTAIHYATLTLMVEAFKVSPAYGTAVGAIIGAVVNYVLNYHFTFASKASHRRTVPRFFAIAALATAMNMGGMWYAAHRLGMHYLLAQLLCTGIVLVVGFVLNRIWTFGTPKVSEAPALSTRVPGNSAQPEKSVLSVQGPKP
jgi:putative flippase GtrA